MANYVTATFNGSETKAVATGLWQWDYGQTLRVEGLALPRTLEVHFHQRTRQWLMYGVTVDGVMTVSIPNEFLQYAQPVVAYIYLHDTETDGETQYEITLPVVAREKPVNYDDTDPATTAAYQALVDATAILRDDIETVQGYANEASDHATAAEGYAINAEDAAAQAAASATAAGAASDTAQAAATAAAQSATQAAGSAQNANASAQDAAQSAQEAAQTVQTVEDAAEQVAADKAAVEAAADTFTETTAPAATAAVQQEGAIQIAAINAAGTAQTGNVNSAGSTQTAAVNAAGATQIQAVTAKGEEYIAEIDTLIEAHIDDTLTQPGMAADAKKTGDELNDLKVAYNVLSPAATSADVGKALIAKTVTDGKVTEYEYGEAGAPPIKDTASGVIASFSDGADNVPMDGVVVTMEPVQDLHGYDNPWPAGGGKNLYSKAIGDDAWHSFNGGSTTNDNGTLTVNMTSTLYSGCYSGSDSTIRAFTSLIGTYSYSVEVKSSVATDIFIGYQQAGNKKVSCTTNWQTVTFNGISFNGTDMSFNIYNGTTTACTCYLRNFQFESGSTCTDYAPYSNICPISGRTGVTVWRSGANLASMSGITIGKNWIGGTASNRAYGTFAWTPGKTYNIAVYGMHDNLNAIVMDVNQSVGDSQAWNTTLSENVNAQTHTAVDGYIGVQFQFTDGSDITNLDGIYIVVTESDIQHIPVTFPTEAGTAYGGTVDAVRGVLTVDRAMVDLGTLNWLKTTGGANNVRFFTRDTQSTVKKVAANNIVANAVCSNYIIASSNSGISGAVVPCITVDTDGTTSIYDTAHDNDTKEAFKSAMSGVQFCYELATPVTYQLDPQIITSLLGQNNVWSDADSVTAEYTADTKLYISKVISAAVAALA